MKIQVDTIQQITRKNASGREKIPRISYNRNPPFPEEFREHVESPCKVETVTGGRTRVRLPMINSSSTLTTQLILDLRLCLSIHPLIHSLIYFSTLSVNKVI